MAIGPRPGCYAGGRGSGGGGDSGGGGGGGVGWGEVGLMVVTEIPICSVVAQILDVEYLMTEQLRTAWKRLSSRSRKG